MAYAGVNWNRPTDDFTKMFWDQNIMQFWTDEEIPLSDDKMSWITLNEDEKQTYMEVLGGLTLLDTIQGGVGMPQILEHVDDLQRKAVLAFMSMMEQIHAKSYSSIFTTLASTEEIDAIFAWVEKNPRLQYKAELVQSYYKNINGPYDLYMAMATSVQLESFLFYSGFFYPLYLAGQGKMTSSGEIIDLILRDESIHGLYVGMLAQEIFATLSPEEQASAKREVYSSQQILMMNEYKYTKEVYDRIGLTDQVVEFLRYNANKAMMNLGFEPTYEHAEINPIVENGIKTTTKQHDFFSKKGNGYVRSLRGRPLRDSDFNFDNV